MIACEHCAFPNRPLRRRCDRCGALLHRPWVRVAFPTFLLALAITILVAILPR
ncbi:MAG: hypothetical protein WCK73_13975 [Deltaproteobacteria bacterium]